MFHGRTKLEVKRLMSRIVLVNSNVTKPPIAPLGLEYVGEACRRRGMEVEIVDLCLEADPTGALQRRVTETDPQLVGITFRNTDNCMLLSSHSFVPELQQVVAAIRQSTDAPVVAGGAGFCVAPEAIMRAAGIDYGVLGDGEEAVPLLLQALRGEMSPQDVPGLLWHDGDGIEGNAPAWPDIADGPALQRDMIDNRRYFNEGGQMGLETKRGCDRKCIFCADPLGKGHRVRRRSPVAVADEVENLLSQGIDVYHLCDSEFNIPEDHALAVCEELAGRGLGDKTRWYAYLAPHPFSGELAEAMRRAGCAGINFGADSGNDEMLARLGRDFSHDAISEAVSLCHEQGIVVMLDLLIGAPGETKETARETIEGAKAAGPSCMGISLGVRVYAGTGMAHFVASEGPLEDNPALWGETEGNEDLLAPVFYIAPALGAPAEAAGFLSDVIAGDQRFFFGGSGDDRDYDYDDNQPLVDAVAAGARGAYWDILRQIRNRNPT